MKKIKEINLRPDTTPASYPTSRGRNPSHMGGLTMSADSAFSRNHMQRVNKNMEEEEEQEIDDYVNNVNDLALIKEFVGGDTLNKFLGVGKSGLMSIPIFGDLFAFGKFLFTIAKMRRASRLFTRKLSKLSMVELGNDFLEAEGKISSDVVLDQNLTEATYRLRNIKEFNERQRSLGKPELKVTNLDIKNLDAKFNLLCKYVKDAIMEFVGFADIALGQKGFFLNVGISMIAFSEIPDYITGEYSEVVRGMKEKAQLKSQQEGTNKDLLDYMKDLAGGVISAPRKMLDFLGNVDLLINPDKLARLSLVHGFLKHYDDIDTNEEKLEAGLTPTPGTDYFYFFQDQKPAETGPTMPSLSSIPIPDEVITEREIKSLSPYLREEYKLAELYEDEEETAEEVDEHFVGGVATPMGTKSDGSRETSAEAEKRKNAADIYRRHLQEIQNWKHMTSGRIK